MLELPPTHLAIILVDEFWPTTRVQRRVSDILNGDGIVRKEFAIDEHYIEPRRDCLQPSFRIAKDCREGFMLLIHRGDEPVYPKPVQVGMALCDPRLVTTSEHYQHVQIQYYVLASRNKNILNSYEGWDSGRCQALQWRLDSMQPPSWIHTDALLPTWKPRVWATTVTLLPAQVLLAKDNLARYMELDDESCDEQGRPYSSNQSQVIS